MLCKLLTTILLLSISAHATPLSRRQNNATINSATLTRYLDSTSCAIQTDPRTITANIVLDQCIDLQEYDATLELQENDASVSFGDLKLTPDGGPCYAQVWKEACNATAESQNFLQLGPLGDVCFGQYTWSDGTSGFGSAVLVCE